MYNLKMDESGQSSTEMILLMAGIILIVLIAMMLYKNYITDFNEEIKNNEYEDLLSKIDELNNKLKLKK